MLSTFDDFPIHPSSAPIANTATSDINHYDRYFFNGYTKDTRLFFAAARRSPRRRDLVLLSWGLVAGVLGQVVLGGIVVLTDLNPVANQGHFLVSMFLVADAVVLLRAAQRPDSAPTIGPRSSSRWEVWSVSVAASAAIVSGTVVTGSGPHAGDERAKRLPFAIETVARIHGVTVIVTLALLLVVMWRLRRRGALGHAITSAMEIVLGIGIVQAAVGYTQYFAEIPAALVALHVALATAMFASVVNLHLVASGRVYSAATR